MKKHNTNTNTITYKDCIKTKKVIPINKKYITCKLEYTKLKTKSDNLGKFIHRESFVSNEYMQEQPYLEKSLKKTIISTFLKNIDITF